MQTLHPQNKQVWQELAQCVPLQTICDALNEIPGTEYEVTLVKKKGSDKDQIYFYGQPPDYQTSEFNF